MHDVTARVQHIVDNSKIQTGFAHVFNIGSTGAELVTEIESESHGFAYLDRRVASIAGQQLLYFIH